MAAEREINSAVKKSKQTRFFRKRYIQRKIKKDQDKVRKQEKGFFHEVIKDKYMYIYIQYMSIINAFFPPKALISNSVL